MSDELERELKALEEQDEKEVNEVELRDKIKSLKARAKERERDKNPFVKIARKAGAVVVSVAERVADNVGESGSKKKKGDSE